tara:strand:+ start:2473 stop:2934 length:462 start_codon:yes stop_codon:yes gene_type:complete
MRTESFNNSINLNGVENSRTYFLSGHSESFGFIHEIKNPDSISIFSDGTHHLIDQNKKEHIITGEDWFAFCADTVDKDFSFDVSNTENNNEEWVSPRDGQYTVYLKNVSHLSELTLKNVSHYLAKDSGSLMVVLDNGTIIYFNKKFLLKNSKQ